MLILVVTVAAAVRLHALDRFSYWFDEILHCYYLHGDSEFFWRSIRFEAVHPPLDYLAGRAFENLHPADWASQSSEGTQPRLADIAFFALAAAGAAMALRRSGSRFLVAWAIGGLAAVEGLYHLHPDWDAARRYLPAAVALMGLAALPVSRLMTTRTGKIFGAALLAGTSMLQAGALLAYFRAGRQDWRPLGSFLTALPADEQVFTENQWSQICTAFYVVGPDWLADGGRHGRPISNLDGEIVRLTYSWPVGKTAWLVIEENPQRQEIRAWAKQFEECPFGTADGARVYRLDPARREAALVGR